MSVSYNKLIGALIGIARAADGNDHLITPAATDVIIKSLTAPQNNPDLLENLLCRAGEEKQKMVPDCFLCANPCGRTRDYDLSELQYTDAQVREAKMRILSGLQKLAVSPEESYDRSILYKGLVVIGMDDYTVEDLMPILQEVENSAF